MIRFLAGAVLSLALSCSAWATFSVVNHNFCTGTCGSGITGGTGTSGNLVIVFMNPIIASPSAPTCSRCGTFSAIGTCAAGPSSTCVNMFYGYLTSSGTYTITIAVGSNCTSFCASAFVEVSGIASSTPLDVANRNPSATSGTGSNNMTAGALTSNAADFCAGGFGASTGPMSAGTATVAWTSPDGDHGELLEYFAQSASGSITAEATDTTTSDAYAAVDACFKPSGGAAPTCNNRIALMGAGCN